MRGCDDDDIYMRMQMRLRDLGREGGKWKGGREGRGEGRRKRGGGGARLMQIGVDISVLSYAVLYASFCSMLVTCGFVDLWICIS